MTQASLPLNETLRMASLRGLRILDTPYEERFDRITRLAERLFSVPIALVSLVDVDRQWFKSCIGLDLRETPRSSSFCAHAILSDEAMVIPDAQLDPRFADNPLVAGPPHIRFYAGQPLIGPNNQRLGTLCIIDHHPRQLNAEDLDALRNLATLAENELNTIEMNQALAIKEESEARIRAVMDNIADGVITFDEQGSIESFNHAAQDLFGYEASDFLGQHIDMLAPQLVQRYPEQ